MAGENPNDEAFEAAFNQITAEPTNVPAVEPVAEPVVEPVAEPVVEPVAEPAPVVEPVVEPIAADEPVVEPAPAPAPASAAPANDDVLARLAEMVKQQPTPTPQPEAPAAEPQPAAYTAEEQELLNSYEQDWPDVSKAEELKRRGEYQQLVSFVFGELSRHLQPVFETVQTLSERTHLTDLTSAVEDYSDVRDKVVEWVDTQPTYLQVAYKHVIQQGTVEEVSDLIKRYKAETGVTIQAPAPTPQPETELPTATKKAAASLAPVSSKRSVVPQSSDPNDFEAAFAAFADKV